MSVLSATHYRRNVGWVIEIECTTQPTAIGLVENEEDPPLLTYFPFTQVGTRIKLTVFTERPRFRLILNTEEKWVVFDSDDDYTELGGDIAAPKNKGTTNTIYIPPCDWAQLKVDVYSFDGSTLDVQDLSSTPFWRVSHTVSMQSYKGKTYPFLPLIVNDTDGAYYLTSAATNAWQKLSSIPHRVVVSGIVEPNSSNISKMITDPNFYGKRFYADF